jgi:hypothetical protein
MRTFLVLICSLALAWVTLGEEQGKKKEYKPGTRTGKPPAVDQPTTVHQPAKPGIARTGKPPAVDQPTTVHQPAKPRIARTGKPPAVDQPTTVHQPQGAMRTGKPPAVGQPTTVHQPPKQGIAPATRATTEEATNAPAPGGGHGLVWVNTESHVYHREGSRFYGTTKKGKYMTEQDATKEGDRAAAKGQ